MPKTAHCSVETEEESGTESRTLDEIIDRYRGVEHESGSRGEREG